VSRPFISSSEKGLTATRYRMTTKNWTELATKALDNKGLTMFTMHVRL